jgi:hypothetical protein
MSERVREGRGEEGKKGGRERGLLLDPCTGYTIGPS